METLLLNLLKNLVVSKATDLSKDIVEKVIEDNLDDGQKLMLDHAVNAMPNDFKNIKQLLT